MTTGMITKVIKNDNPKWLPKTAVLPVRSDGKCAMQS
jgi:hypothetical protein